MLLIIGSISKKERKKMTLICLLHILYIYNYGVKSQKCFAEIVYVLNSCYLLFFVYSVFIHFALSYLNSIIIIIINVKVNVFDDEYLLFISTLQGSATTTLHNNISIFMYIYLKYILATCTNNEWYFTFSPIISSFDNKSF